MKNIAILGSTGSIGTQTLDVIRLNPDKYCVNVITANNNADLLIQQAIEFQPSTVVIANDSLYPKVNDALKHLPIKVFRGNEAIESVVTGSEIDIVLTALVGFSGLKPTINAIKHGKTIALANKETLVVAGELINKLCLENQVALLPVDSEHSAIFQCLAGEISNPIEKIYLTASGGPFKHKTSEELQQVRLAEALKHPNWSMGKKITIDSASLMNKGFEAIEAKWLFGLKPEQIDILIHPQSIIHSMVQFTDGSVKAQLGMPDMRLPIQYALGFPDRISNDFERVDFLKFNKLTFEGVKRDVFPTIDFAFECMQKGGNLACILNASNEIAVDAFLNGKIQFVDIFKLIEKGLTSVDFIKNPTISQLIETDTITRNYIKTLI